MAGSVIGALRVNLGLDSAQFTRGTRQAQTDMERMSARMKVAGVALAGALGSAFAAIGKTAVEGAVAQRQAVAQVEAALASMGNAVGRTSAQLVAAADAMEMRSLFDGDVILKQVTANLLTFGNVAGEQFDRAQQAAIDMATRLGGEPQAAAIMLGKALNDPVKGISALTRVGVQFTDQQKAQIKAMAEAGNAAGAQGVILAEVERQFRGAAAAAADASPYRQFQVILDQMSDTIGEALLPSILAMRDAVVRNREAILGAVQSAVEFGGSLVRLVQFLSPLIAGVVAYRVALLAGAVAQGAYTAAMVAGTRAIGAARAGALGLNAAMAANPFGAVAVAVGVLATAFIGLANSQAQAKAKTDDLIVSLKAAAQARSADFALQRRALAARIGVLETPQATSLSERVARAVGGGFAADAVGAEDTKELIRLRKELAAADEAYEAAGEAAKSIVVPTGNATAAVSGLSKELTGAGASAKAASDDFARLYDRLFPFQAASRKFAEEMAAIQTSRLSDAQKELAISRLESEAFRNRTRGLGDATVSSWLTKDTPLIDIAENARKVISDLEDDAKTKTVTVAENFAQMSQKITASLQGLANSIRSGDFLGILGGVIDLFSQLGSIGAFGKTIQANLNKPVGGARAMGGPVSMGKQYLVGENGPEMFAPGRSGTIIPNHAMGRTHVTVGIDPANGNITAFVNGQIAATAPAIAGAGAAMAQGQMAARARRRVR